MNRITLLTSASDKYKSILELSGPNKLDYCIRHGLQLSVRKHENEEDLAIERQIFMIDALTTCEWLWFMGADTLIMDHTIDVRQYLDEEYDLIITEDVNGINNDVFFLKNSPEGRKFLVSTLANNSVFPNDQESMKAAIEDSVIKVKIMHQKQFNSYLYNEYNYLDDGGGSYSKGDFVLHLPGIPNERRQTLMEEYLQLVVK